MLGPLPSAQAAGVWVCSGMGSRGLTFAALCAELLAARLHAEPLAVEQRLVDGLAPQYVSPVQGLKT
jgi:tRNA 5-methylaminomethyl-2-thiouridine biosynthesis bifunctional protein